MHFKGVTATKYKLEITERTTEEAGGVPIQCIFDENAQYIFVQMRNSYKKSVEITASLLLGCCLLCYRFLDFRLLCRCLLCCCHVVSTSYRNGLYFF